MRALGRPTAAAQARRLTLAGLVGAVMMALAGCMPGPLIHPVGPKALGRSVAARQQVTVHYRGHTRSLQVALRVVPDDLTLIGLSAMGQRLFTLGWDGHSITRKNGLEASRRLPAQRILADLELAYWPLPALRPALADNGMTLEQLGSTRTLWQRGKLLWIAYRGPGAPWHRRVMIYNARLGYRLDVQPLDFNVPSE